jgi:hypothetical protein
MSFESCDFKRVGEKNTPLCELRGRTTVDDEELTVAIWLTEKSAGIARQQFKRIGFDIDKHELHRLGDFLKEKKPTAMVTVESYDRQGTILYRGVIEVGSPGLPKEELSTFTKFMRAAKKDKEEPVSEPKSAPPRPAAPIKQGYDPDSIPFAFILAALTVGASMIA